jgi:phosphatidate cytidylyltransferase
MNLALRVVSGAVLLGVVAAVLWIGVPAVAVIVVVAALIGASEFAGLMARVAAAPLNWVLYPLTIWLALRFLFPPAYIDAGWALAAALAVGLIGAVLRRGSFAGWASALAGAVYLGFSLGFFIGMYRWHAVDADHFGLRLVALVVLAVMAGDTFAYFAGSALGRRPFFASISPKKTVEGAAIGAAAAVLVGALAGPALVAISVPAGAGLGALVAVAAQGGDLAESALKRAAGVKDSGSLIPGHGGLLDRVDSLVLVGPVVYCYLRLISL